MKREILGKCPVCDSEVKVTEIHCKKCETTIRSEFDLCKFCKLSGNRNILLKCLSEQRKYKRN